MKTILPTALLAAAALHAAPAAAQSALAATRADCALTIQTSAANWYIQGYDPFASNPPIASFDVTFNNEGGAACVFDPVFVLDQEPFGLTQSGRQVRVSYTLLDQFSNANATPISGRTIGTATRRPVVVQPRSQQLVRYQFAVDEDGLTGDGLYSQRVMLTAEGRGQNGTLASRALVLGVNVLPSAVLGLSGQFTRVGGQALIDLGELHEGTAQVPLQVRVASTRAYRLEFASRNAGQLMMADSRWSVPYGLAVGDKSLSLASRAVYESNDTTATSASLPLRFVIGDASGKRAGTYSDVVTISIAPK